MRSEETPNGTPTPNPRTSRSSTVGSPPFGRADVRIFDRWAEIFDRWVASAPICAQHPDFYVPLYVETEGLAVELGVGNGRLLLEAAERGKEIVGVDVSPAMLQLCRSRAEERGLSDRVILVEGDFRDFELPSSAALITIPFHSIGHLPTIEDKRCAIRHIFDQLEPGGRLVFDHFVYNRKYAQQQEGMQTLRDVHRREDGTTSYLWVTASYCAQEQTMRVICVEDRADPEGRVESRTIRELDFSWIDPAQSRSLLTECGFAIEAEYGSFDREPLTDDSPTQLWLARKPR